MATGQSIHAIPDKGRTQQARAAARALIEARGLSIADIAAQIGVSGQTIRAWLKNEYRGNNTRIEFLVLRWLETERDVSSLRVAGLDRHADLAVTEQVDRVVRHAHANRDVVVIFGHAGGGKTWAARRYCQSAAGAFYVSMSPALTTPAAVLTRIARALDVGAGLTTGASLELAVVDRLSVGETLLTVDEAHHLTQGLLDVIRCVHDAAGCGIAFLGNDPLWAKLASGERAAQLVSRVGLTYRLRAPASTDILALATTLLHAPPTGAARAAVLAAGGGLGGLRAVRKLIGQAHILAAGDDRDRPTLVDVADAAELLRSA